MNCLWEEVQPSTSHSQSPRSRPRPHSPKCGWSGRGQHAPAPLVAGKGDLFSLPLVSGSHRGALPTPCTITGSRSGTDPSTTLDAALAAAAAAVLLILLLPDILLWKCSNERQPVGNRRRRSLSERPSFSSPSAATGSHGYQAYLAQQPPPPPPLHLHAWTNITSGGITSPTFEL